MRQNLPFHEEISHLYNTLSNQRFWCLKLKPVSNVQCVFTIVMAIITLLLYIIFGTPQCDMQEFKKGKHLDPAADEVAYPYKYNFRLDQPEKCQHKPFLVIIVQVAPKDVMERQAIRNTWGDEKLVQEKHVVVLFLMGLPSGSNAEIQQDRIHQENLRHRDLLQSNFIDSVKNATIKTMVMLEWLRDRCPQAYYTAKVDNDILLNVRSLISMLLNPRIPQMNYITGQVQQTKKAKQNPSSRFYNPSEIHTNKLFPPYPLGKCYIMSMDMPAKILRASTEIKPILEDDMYIGLCLEWLHIAPVKPPKPSQFVFIYPQLYNRCYYSELIAVILYTPAQLVNLWTDIHKPGTAC
ncbi:beta-1,3-galactosyltransferase 2-like [Tachysurus vachellii]|uniref:beta-1,3-galactosyltransferase 2-like n=1 Tax=Tachysurus vachellii TaxID=175792 RepID=UPI00296AA91D|nr:beta-1,3-galactosyltransferase 2-like [Tachysurus vachellii]XP_060715417.1 beta-1,3-galactosyltransferase 2-like [Tachysurus vachellii]